MQKKLWSLLLAGSLLATSSVGEAAILKQQPKPIHITIDGKEIVSNPQPLIKNGRAFVPLRGVFDVLGADISWDAQTFTVHAERMGKEIVIPIGSMAAQVDGKGVRLQDPAFTVEGRTYVPLRFLSEAIGARVSWDANTNTISIQSNGMDLATDLVPLIKGGRYNDVLQALKQGASPNSFTAQGNTALIEAIKAGKKELVQALLDGKAATSTRKNNGLNPLTAAIESKQTDIAKLLIASNGDLNTKDIEGEAPLIAAVAQNDKDVIRSLMAAKADLNMKNKDGIPAIMLEYDKDHDLVMDMIKAGADPNAGDKTGESLLLRSFREDKYDFAEELLALKADPNHSNQYGETALHIAVERKSPRYIELLFKNDKLKPDLRNEKGLTPLGVAVDEGSSTIADYLLQHKSNPNLKNNDGQSLLEIAITKGSYFMVDKLLSYGAFSSIKCSDGGSLITKAIKMGDAQLVDLLIKHGAFPKEDDLELAKSVGNSSVISSIQAKLK